MRALRLKVKTQDDLIEAVKARLGGGCDGGYGSQVSLCYAAIYEGHCKEDALYPSVDADDSY